MSYSIFNGHSNRVCCIFAKKSRASTESKPRNGTTIVKRQGDHGSTQRSQWVSWLAINGFDSESGDSVNCARIVSLGWKGSEWDAVRMLITKRRLARNLFANRKDVRGLVWWRKPKYFVIKGGSSSVTPVWSCHRNNPVDWPSSDWPWVKKKIQLDALYNYQGPVHTTC